MIIDNDINNTHNNYTHTHKINEYDLCTMYTNGEKKLKFRVIFIQIRSREI